MKSSPNIGAIASLLSKSNVKGSPKAETVSNTTGQILDIPLDLIEFDNEQPRQDIIEDEVYDIVRTLRVEGSKINQPITTWPKNSDGKYVIKFGEKRTRASRIAERKTIPVIIDERYDYGNERHRAINFAEQYVENNARGGLTRLDDCVALLKLKELFGNLKDVAKFVGAKSQGTISDKIKVSEIKTNPVYQFLLDFYNDDSLKFKDLTNLKKIIETFRKNPNHFDEIKKRIITSVNEGIFNRQWIEMLSSVDFDNENLAESVKSTKTKKKTKSKNIDAEASGYKVRPVKKAKIMGLVSIDRKKQRCQLLLDRIDDEEGYIWVLVDGEEEPIRVSLSKLTLTELS